VRRRFTSGDGAIAAWLSRWRGKCDRDRLANGRRFPAPLAIAFSEDSAANRSRSAAFSRFESSNGAANRPVVRRITTAAHAQTGPARGPSTSSSPICGPRATKYLARLSSHFPRLRYTLTRVFDGLRNLNDANRAFFLDAAAFAGEVPHIEHLGANDAPRRTRTISAIESGCGSGRSRHTDAVPRSSAP